MAIRVISGVVKRPDGSPWSGGIVRFRLTPDTFRASPAETYPEDAVAAVADAFGDVSVTLVSGTDLVYRVTLPGPNGDQFDIAVPDGSATTLEALRASYAGAPATVDSVEAALIALYGEAPVGRPALTVQEGDLTAVNETTHLDFAAAHFDVVGGPAGEANVSIAAAISGGDRPDDTFRIVDNGDATKKIAFEASGIATGTTCTLTAPNASGTIALTGHTHAPAVTVRTNTVAIANGANGGVSVACSAGEVCTGGGAKFGVDHAGAIIHTSHPNPESGEPTGWTARGANTTGSTRTLTVHAVCMTTPVA